MSQYVLIFKTGIFSYVVQIKISPGYYDLFRYLIPFVVVVSFCFIVLLVSLVGSFSILPNSIGHYLT